MLALFMQSFFLFTDVVYNVNTRFSSYLSYFRLQFEI